MQAHEYMALLGERHPIREAFENGKCTWRYDRGAIVVRIDQEEYRILDFWPGNTQGPEVCYCRGNGGFVEPDCPSHGMDSEQARLAYLSREEFDAECDRIFGKQTA